MIFDEHQKDLVAAFKRGVQFARTTNAPLISDEEILWDKLRYSPALGGVLCDRVGCRNITPHRPGEACL